MDRRLGPLLLAIVILLAGCVAPVSGGDRPAGALEPTETPETLTDSVRELTDDVRTLAAADQELTATADAAPTETADSNRTVVSVETSGDRAPPIEPVVQAANYWERNGAPGDRVYDVVPHATDPDVVLRVADRPLQCGTPDGRPAFYCVRDAGAADDGQTAVLSPGLTAQGYESAAAAALGRLAGKRAPLDRSELAEPAFTDPWPATDTVTVRIETPPGYDRDVEPLVRETLRYWEDNDDEYATYTTDWKLTDARDADVTVAFVEEVQRCGDHPDPSGLIGCAPVRDPGNLADGDERVRVVSGYDDATTRLILKHEFGHIYGISHGKEPTDVMVTSISTSSR